TLPTGRNADITCQKRTIIAILPAAAQQLIGAAFVLGYITYLLSLLGIEEYFKVSVALYCCMLASNASAFPLIETAGRRPLLLIGITALTVIELVCVEGYARKHCTWLIQN